MSIGLKRSGENLAPTPPIRHMIVLYPSYSFETLSTGRDEVEAGELLALWSAVFHPAALESEDSIPRWESASTPPYDFSGSVIVIPPCCESTLQENWFKQQEEAGTILIRHIGRREELIAKLLEIKGISNHGFDDDYVNDFLALGTSFFLTDLLVRQLHYMSMLDDAQLKSQVFESIRAYRQEDVEKAKDHLKQAFEAIVQSKEYFYPIQSYLLDLTLVTASTTGESFRALLESGRQVNLFLSCRLLRELPETAPESFEKLKSACGKGNVQFVVDDSESGPLLLWPILDVADRILEGLSIYRELLGVSPLIYGRLGIGMTPVLPQILRLAGLKGAIHFAPIDGWRIKEQTQSKMIWKGVDGTKLDALIRYPINPSSSEEFFSLPDQVGQIIDNDHAPTAVFARFPGQQSPWLEDLARADQYALSIGKMVSLNDYFDKTPSCGGVQDWDFAKYPGNVLNSSTDAGESDPISSWNRIYRESLERLAASAFSTISELLGKTASDQPDLERFAEAVCGKRPIRASEDQSQDQSQTAIFLGNPWSFPRRVFLDVSHWPALPAETKPIVLAREKGERKEIVVDVPPLGFAVIEPPKSSVSKSAKKTSGGMLGLFGLGSKEEPSLIEKIEESLPSNVKRSVYLLRNEFFEAKVDTTTGMLRSIFTDDSRFNRLSQQIGVRLPRERRNEDLRSSSDPNRGYGIMAADDISVDSTGPISGRLAIRGRLVLSDGSVAATFAESITIRRKSRILEFHLSLEPADSPDSLAWDKLLGGLPWDSYFAVRFAWNDNTLDFRGGLADGVHPLRSEKLQSPKFVDLRNVKNSLTFFTEGLPFHRRFGERQLDTILVSKGESTKRFRFGIGVDVSHPVLESLDFMGRSLDSAWSAMLPASENSKILSSWLFHIEAKNVQALHWEPLREDDRPIGFRVYLLETEGRRAHFAMHSFRPPVKASAVDLLGEVQKEFKVDDDRILVDMHGHELLPLEVRFA